MVKTKPEIPVHREMQCSGQATYAFHGLSTHKARGLAENTSPLEQRNILANYWEIGLEVAVSREMNSVAVNDIDIGLMEKDFSYRCQRIGKIVIVGVKPADDFARGVLPSFLNGSCLAFIPPVVLIRSYPCRSKELSEHCHQELHPGLQAQPQRAGTEYFPGCGGETRRGRKQERLY